MWWSIFAWLRVKRHAWVRGTHHAAPNDSVLQLFSMCFFVPKMATDTIVARLRRCCVPQQALHQLVKQDRYEKMVNAAQSLVSGQALSRVNSRILLVRLGGGADGRPVWYGIIPPRTALQACNTNCKPAAGRTKLECSSKKPKLADDATETHSSMVQIAVMLRLVHRREKRRKRRVATRPSWVHLWGQSPKCTYQTACPDLFSHRERPFAGARSSL